MRIGDYEVLEEVGRGGAGQVFRARSAGGEVVAVKVVPLAKGDARERFEREARMLATLGQEDGFVPFVASGTTPSGCFLVMPFLAGGTLRARLQDGPLPVADAVAIVRTLAAAMGRAHAKAIVHRDLKPENVLFTESGQPLVADVGLAKHVHLTDAPGATQSVLLSRSQEVRGTVGYMAPEQAGDSRDATPAADVFALGAILHECVTGAPAFTGGTALEVLARAQMGEVTPLRRLRRDAPAWLEAVVARALARDPKARFADGSALAAALDPDAARARGGRRVVLVVGLAALVVAAVVAALGAARALDGRSRAPAPALPGAPGAPAPPGRPAGPSRSLPAAELYRLALEGPAPVASLRALAEVEPPAALASRVAAVWLREAERLCDVNAVAESVVPSSITGEGDDGVRQRGALARGLERLDTWLEPLGRAFAADPSMDRFPKRLGPTFSLVRLLAKPHLGARPEVAPLWAPLIAHLGDHPASIYVQCRLSDQGGAPIDATRDLARRAIPALEGARERTAHVRALADNLSGYFALRGSWDRGDLASFERLARVADYRSPWRSLATTRANLTGSAIDKTERERGEPFPARLASMFEFDPRDED